MLQEGGTDRIPGPAGNVATGRAESYLHGPRDAYIGV